VFGIRAASATNLCYQEQQRRVHQLAHNLHGFLRTAGPYGNDVQRRERVKLMASQQHTVTQQMDDEADSLFFALVDAGGDLPAVLSKVNDWLCENPAHRVAWARAQRTSRLLVALLKAGEPDASKEEIEAFFEAIAEERRRRAAEEFPSA
jgi:hypothetical protein